MRRFTTPVSYTHLDVYKRQSNYYTITNGVRYYNIMTDFADSAARVCAPTAATNLCKYWYLRNPSEYGNLLKGNSWNNAFDSLAEDVYKRQEQQYLGGGIFCADYGICNVRADVVL